MSEHPHLPTITTPDGHVRPLGLVPSDPRWVKSVPPMFAASDLLPESEWVEFEDEWPKEIPIEDQNGYGACNGHAADLSLELARYVAGYSFVRLSAWYVYAILCNGVDRGSSIGDALTLIQNDGCAPFDLVPYGTINPRKLSPEAHGAAGRFKAVIAGMLDSREAIATAVQRRVPINGSICVGMGFGPDASGTVAEGIGWDNHAICHWGGMRKFKGCWQVKWQNSWTPQWGVGGMAWRWLDGCIGRSSEFYGVRAVAPDPLAKDDAPPAKVA